MADTKISGLPASTTPLAGTEVLPIVQSSSTVQVSVANLTAGRAVATGALTVTGTLSATGTATLGANSLAVSGVASTYNFINSPSGYLQITSAGNTFLDAGAASTGSLRIGTTTIASWSSTGLAVTGTLSVTTGAAVGGATAGAGGLAFPATAVAVADANTLDDYEEGTWTPIDSSGASLSFTGVSGSYTKVGRCVTAFAEVTYPSTASAASAIIGGLPFTSTGSGPGINGYIRYTTVATSVITFVSGGTSATTVSLLRPGVNTTNVSMSGGTLLFAAIYFV